jgi:hypothetical protein
MDRTTIDLPTPTARHPVPTTTMTNDLAMTGITVTVVAQGNVAVTPGPFRGCRDASPDPTLVTLFGGGAFFCVWPDIEQVVEGVL